MSIRHPRRALAALSGVLMILTLGCGVPEPQQSEPIASLQEPTTLDPVPTSMLAMRDRTDDPEVVEVQHPAPVIVAHAVVDSVTVHASADDASPVVTTLANPTVVGGPMVFQLVETTIESGPWLEVHLPIRPNGSTGWVRTEDVELSSNPFRIEIDRLAHRMQVFRGSDQLIDTTVAIGTGATPTPIGQFYIIELLKPDTDDGPYGPFAFGLSGFSETLPNFAGGQGVIGVHGTDDPAALGQDVSHGCVRVSNEIISVMAGLIPLGTPVAIT